MSATIGLNIKTHGTKELSVMKNSWTEFNQALEVGKKILGQIVQTANRAKDALMGIVNTGANFETYTVQWETLLGSTAAAEERMRSLFTFAASTPFQLPGVVDAARIMESFGVYSERALTAAGDMASAFGKPFQDAAMAIAGATTGEMERLKAFGITSFHIAEEIGHKINRSTKEGLKEVEEAVISLFEKKAMGGMVRMSKTYKGIMSMFADEWMKFSKLINDSGLFVTVRDVFGILLESIRETFASGDAEKAAMAIGKTLSQLFLDTIKVMVRATIEMAKVGEQLGAFLSSHDVVGGLKRFMGKGGSNINKPGADAMLGGTPIGDSGKWYLPDPSMWDKAAALFSKKTAEEIRGGSMIETPDWYRAMMQVDKPIKEEKQDSPLIKVLEKLLGRLDAYEVKGPVVPDTYGSLTDAVMPTAGFRKPDGDSLDKLMEITDPAGENRFGKFNEDLEDWKDKLESNTALAAGYWRDYYTGIEKVGIAWGKGEGKLLTGIWKASKATSRNILADWVQMKTKKAALGKLEAIAEMFTAQGTFNFWSAAKFAASAAAWTAVGGIAGGAIRGDSSAPDPTPVSIVDTDGGDTYGQADGVTSFSKTATLRAQNLSIVVNINHHGVTSYGLGGLREMVDTEVIPAIEDAIQLGAMGVA